MEIVAKQTYVRTSVQKLTDVTRVVKNLSVPRMRSALVTMNKDAAKRILETLNQAIANAQNNHGISMDKLIVKELLILRGPHYKRMRAVSRGMGHAILKKTSHIVIKLGTSDTVVTKEENKKEEASVSQKVVAEQKAPVKKATTARKSTVKKVAKEKTE